MTMFERGLGIHARRLGQAAGKAVVYRRGAVSVPIVATRGQTTYEQDLGDGRIVRAQTQDWILDAIRLGQTEIGSLPQAGDQIIEQSGGRCVTWELMSLGRGTAWERSGQSDLVRVHTKEV